MCLKSFRAKDRTVKTLLRSHKVVFLSSIHIKMIDQHLWRDQKSIVYVLKMEKSYLYLITVEG